MPSRLRMRNCLESYWKSMLVECLVNTKARAFGTSPKSLFGELQILRNPIPKDPPVNKLRWINPEIGFEKGISTKARGVCFFPGLRVSLLIFLQHRRKFPKSSLFLPCFCLPCTFQLVFFTLTFSILCILLVWYFGGRRPSILTSWACFSSSTIQAILTNFFISTKDPPARNLRAHPPLGHLTDTEKCAMLLGESSPNNETLLKFTELE